METPPVEWRTEQARLKRLIALDPVSDPTQRFLQHTEEVTHIGGFDISYSRKNSKVASACFVVLHYPSLELVYEDRKLVQVDQPYIAGFLAFREVTHYVVLYKAFQQKLDTGQLDVSTISLPQVCLVDGNGIFHPNQFGIASHLGVLLDISTIGVAKSFLNHGQFQKPYLAQLNQKLEEAVTAYCATRTSISSGCALVKCYDQSEDRVLMVAMRKRDPARRKNIYVSPGHRVSIEACIAIVTTCCKVRVPEPIRLADHLSKQSLTAVDAAKQS